MIKWIKVVKRIFTFSILLLFVSFLVPQRAYALVACPSNTLNCVDIDQGGGCTSPCVRVVTRIGSRGVPGECQCQLPTSSCSNDGESCLGAQCCSAAPYCWGIAAQNQGITCHKFSQSDARYSCTNGQCVAGETGTYANFGDCSTACTASSTSSKLCPDGKSINTAIGCIPMLGDDNGVAFYGFILKWAIGIGGGIAFLLIVYAGFMIMTSSGNPDRLKAGQELLTSAISGLVLLVLSVFVLSYIGADILGLCKFGFGKAC